LYDIQNSRRGGGTPSIGLAISPVLEVLHTHTLTLINPSPDVRDLPKTLDEILAKEKKGRYYIDRKWGQFQTRCTPPNMILSWDTGGTLRDK